MLLLVAVALLLITGLTVGVLSVTSMSLFLNNKQQFNAISLNLAESGAEVAALWLRDQPYPPSTATSFDPFGGAVDLGDGEYQVTIYPHEDNPTAFLKTFQIVSEGTFQNVSRRVEIVVKQSSFGKFAYFTDSETSSISGGAIWWKAGERVDGPVHSNNTSGSNFNINYNGSTAPIFLDMVTGAGPTINYYPQRPRNETEFKKIFADGSKGFKLGVPRIELPPSSDGQKKAAWGGTTYPSNNGVYLRAGNEGGLYVRGDCNMELRAAGSQQEIVITQGTNVTTVTIDRIAGTTSVSGPVGAGSATFANALPNGVVYCTGNINSLYGTVADNYYCNGEIIKRSEMTIATDVNCGKSITITNNLVYKTKPDKTQPSSSSCNLAAGTLGLVAKDIKLASTAPNNLEINAVCLAGGQNTSGGSFYAVNYNTRGTGTLKVIGGLIQKARGPVGTFDQASGQTKTGYTKDYSYDPRLAQYPPPYYPTTGQYDRLSWRVLAAEE